jgi:hypothetical protein
MAEFLFEELDRGERCMLCFGITGDLTSVRHMLICHECEKFSFTTYNDMRRLIERVGTQAMLGANDYELYTEYLEAKKAFMERLKKNTQSVLALERQTAKLEFTKTAFNFDLMVKSIEKLREAKRRKRLTTTKPIKELEKPNRKREFRLKSYDQETIKKMFDMSPQQRNALYETLSARGRWIWLELTETETKKEKKKKKGKKR